MSTLNDAIAFLNRYGYEVRQRPDGLYVHGPGLHGRIDEDALISNVDALRKDDPMLLPALHVSKFETTLRRTIAEQLGARPTEAALRDAGNLLLLLAEDLERQAQEAA